MTGTRERIVHVRVDSLSLEGALAVPPAACGIVLFAHGSGSSRHSPRNNFVASELRAGGGGTLLMDLPLGYFGASTGAAAALKAAAALGPDVAAVVSRGGRPDLAMADLPHVQAPTLLIVGERDDVVLDLNRRAFEKLGARKELVVVPRATHLFEEPGTLEEVARLARDWFARYLIPRAGERRSA